MHLHVGLFKAVYPGVPESVPEALKGETCAINYFFHEYLIILTLQSQN
jgi:hypothetical protein